jgi:hypothetical protein
MVLAEDLFESSSVRRDLMLVLAACLSVITFTVTDPVMAVSLQICVDLNSGRWWWSWLYVLLFGRQGPLGLSPKVARLFGYSRE